MNESVRKASAPFVLGGAFIASLFLSEVFNASVIFVAVATMVAVVVSYVVWPSRIIVVAMVMVVVATLFPISAMYVAANSGEEKASLSEILGYIVWWKNVVPLVTAVTTAYLLKHLRFAARGTS